MSTRRNFFQTLAAAPLALLGVKFAPEVFQLPIGCDLSFCSLELACQEARRLNLGRGRVLAVGPENVGHAREMLGVPGEGYNQPDEACEALQREMFRYEVRDNLPRNVWRVEFERGVIEGHGP